jgi:hypothetical protein
MKNQKNNYYWVTETIVAIAVILINVSVGGLDVLPLNKT